MKVPCKISDVMLENDNGFEVEGVVAECSQCGHVTESFGTSDASVKRCLALMGEECPGAESNFYVEEE